MLYAGVVLPLTFMTIFVAEALWIWHSIVDFTRDGARYAVTHYCQAPDGSNVVATCRRTPRRWSTRRSSRPAARPTFRCNIWMARASRSAPAIAANCVPDSVSVSVANYQFGRLAGYLKLPAIPIPPFTTNLPMESAGLDPTLGCAQ